MKANFKYAIISLALWIFSEQAQGQNFQFIVKVQDETGKPLGGVNLGFYHVRTADDGVASINLPEGRSAFRLHLIGYVDRDVSVITSRIVRDNEATFELKRIPDEARIIVVKGDVTASSAANEKIGVANTVIKLLYAGHEVTTQSGEDGSFSFAIPDVKIESYEWSVHYFHPDYYYVAPVRFSVPKTNRVELHLGLRYKSDSDTLKHAWYFIIDPIPWKTANWEVLDLGDCACVSKNESGFQVNNPAQGVHLRVIRKGYADVEFTKTRAELSQITTAEYVHMRKNDKLAIARVNTSLSAGCTLFSNGLLAYPVTTTISVLWHPKLSGAVNNKLALIASYHRGTRIDTHDKYETLGGLVGDVQSEYRLVDDGVGVRYYLKNFMSQAPILFIQAQVDFIRQEPTGYFSEDNFMAERKSYSYVTPSLAIGIRKNFSSFVGFEGGVSLSTVTVRSQSFIFNYYGNANSVEDRTPLVNIGVNAGLVFYFPLRR